MVSRSSVPHSVRGFTLVELMVVIAVMAILAVLAAPSFNEFIAKQRVKSAAYDLAQTLQTARSNAILNRRSVDVRASYPTTGNNWNGPQAGTLFDANVDTADQDKITNSSFYIFETGSGLNSTTTGVVNRVTKVSALNDNVVVNATVGTTNPVLIRFTPESGVQTSASTTGTPVAIGASNVSFVVGYSGSSIAGYNVTLNHFGGTQVKKN